jgi:DDE superfamily endonuclease
MDREIFDLYTDYIISSMGSRTATGLSDLTDGDVSHDTVTRFLSKEEYSSKTLWKNVKPIVRKVEQENGLLIFDDTIEEKPHTDENEIICWHFDHAKNRSVKGINILSALVRYEDVALPVAYELVRKTETYDDPKTGKTKRRANRTKNEMFRSMIDVCAQNQMLFRYVLADSWFSSKENMEHIRELNKHFIFAIKSNRTVALSREEKLRGEFKSVSELNLKEGEATLVFMKGLDFGVLLVKQVFTNKDGSTGILYLVCSDTTLDASQIIDLYKKRWRIEEYHKSIKSNMGLEKSPTRTVRTQNNHIFSCLCAFVKLECLSIKKHLNHFALKYKLILKANQIAFTELRKMQE